MVIERITCLLQSPISHNRFFNNEINSFLMIILLKNHDSIVYVNGQKFYWFQFTEGLFITWLILPLIATANYNCLQLLNVKGSCDVKG